jgi:hypothetical protein
MSRFSQVDVYRELLAHAPLEADARAELARLMHLLKRDRALSMYGFGSHLYPFLTNTLSPTQNLLLKQLNSFKGDLLRAAYERATRSNWGRNVPREDFENEIEYWGGGIEQVARAVGRKTVNSPQLAFVFLFFDVLEFPDFRFTREDVATVADHYCEVKTHFWLDHGVGPKELTKLGMSLLGYTGEETLSQDDLRSRFCLSISHGPQGLRVCPLERWGTHRVTESQTSKDYPAEPWLPSNTLVTHDQLAEFEDLLRASPATETDWQRFLARNDVFLCLLGDFEQHRRELRMFPQILVDEDAVEPDLQPDFFLKRIGMDRWDILEVKLPQVRLTAGRRSRRRLSASVHEAIAQVKRYGEFFQDRANTAWFRERYSLGVSNPRLHLLIGRDLSFQSIEEKTEFGEREGVKILTYDDLHRIAKHRSIK